MPDTSRAIGAVFISYAREDGETARRIAEALRGFGLEVWFDMSELRGGDAWDVKLRRQIRECALFIPVISGATQGRKEGYFRREWKLAVERTHDMAHGVPFLVPVVVDGTREDEALVPEEFMRAQWTRLPGGVPTPEFVSQIKRLLEAPQQPVRRRATADARTASTPRHVWLTPVLALVAAGAIATAVYLAFRPASRPPEATAPEPAAVEKPPVAAPSVPAAAAVDPKSIAVLPFANLCSDRDDGFFADGIHDDVITNLTKVRALKVISRTSVLAYRDPAARNIRKIAAELGVANILEGTVRKLGNKVHMDAQLIDARTENDVWADSFDGDANDIFALQAKLAQAIAAALKTELGADERSLIERRPTENQDAYDLYLRAQALYDMNGDQAIRIDFERMVSLYEQAVAKDPNFGLAYAQLAIADTAMYWFGTMDPRPERAAKARREVDAALRLSPDAPETHLAMGYYSYRVDLDWNRALAEFRAAQAGLPNDAQLMLGLAAAYRRLGRWQESVTAFERSIELNPRDLSAANNGIGTLLGTRRFDHMRTLLARELGFYPGQPVFLRAQAIIRYAQDGDRDAFLRTLDALHFGDSDQNLGFTSTMVRFRVALARGDFAAADHLLAESKRAYLVDTETSGGALNTPIAHFRTLVSYLQGDRESARRYSDQAIALYREGKWNRRQIPWAHMGIAEAETWAGQTGDGLRGGETALAEMGLLDKYDENQMRSQYGAMLIVAGRRDEALDILRQLMAGYSSKTPAEFRIDPIWSRLKDDPRFDEILNSAKPL